MVSQPDSFVLCNRLFEKSKEHRWLNLAKVLYLSPGGVNKSIQ